MLSATEAEILALFMNVNTVILIRNSLIETGHP